MTEEQIVQNADSKGFIIDYLSIASGQRNGLGIYGHSAPFDLNKALTIIKNDPMVRAAITTLVDKTLETKWLTKGRDKKSRNKELEQKLKDVRFNKVLRKALFNLFLFNNTFLEIVKTEEKFKDLNILESTFMKIDAEDNGDIVGYYQDVGTFNKNPYWTEDKVGHIKLDEITTNTWSDLTIEALYETVLIKDFVRQWLMWFFGTNQMRGFYNIKEANTQKVREFISYLKGLERDKTKPVIAEGEVTYQVLASFAEQGQSLGDLLKWCDEQILVLLQVPPIAVGIADASGRSNSFEQYAALNTRTLAVQRILEDAFSYDIFPKMGFQKVDFIFGVLDESTRAKIFETAQIMKNMMMTDDAIVEYLESQGVVFDTTNLFKDPVEEAKKMQEVTLSNKDVGAGNEGMIGNKPQSTAPSRKTQSNSELSKGNQKTMVKNAVDKFNKYPYVIEVKEDV